MPATKIFEDDDEFPTGDRWEAIAWNVPVSDEFPEGLKYSFQYLGPADEEILRYDNANDAHGVGDTTATTATRSKVSIRGPSVTHSEIPRGD